jgi:hypothetical protein
MKKVILLFFITLYFVSFVKAENIKTIIQLDSTISEGAYTPLQIAAYAHKYGIGAIAMTDRDLQKWEYGLWPIRNLLKKTVENKSILKGGAQDYLDTISAAQKKFPNITIIPGTESAPFYRWELSFPGPILTMLDWHKHIISLGLLSVDDYRNIPIIGNNKGLYSKINYPRIIILMIIISTALYFKTSKPIIAIALMIIGALFFCDSYPFRTLKFNQYAPAINNLPYQNYIDYINKKNGVSFWAHPQAEDISKIGNIKFITEKHSKLLALTKNYTGFAVFYEGYDTIADPGGLWDKLLMDFIHKKRSTPTFAIGAIALDKERDIETRIQDLQTIVDVQKNDTLSIINALKSGRMYTARGANSLKFNMSEFFLFTDKSKAFSGETLEINGPFYLRMVCGFTDGVKKIRIKIISNEKIINERSLIIPTEFDFQINQPPKTAYYRIEITGEDLHVITNPIFVNFKNKMEK